MDAAASVPAAKQQGDTAFRSGRYQEAIAAYGQAVALSEQQQQPDLLHLLYSNRSAARLSLQDYKGALADAQASVAVNDRCV